MASTYNDLKIQLMTTGENLSTWGNVTNVNLGTAITEAIAGSADVTFASGTVTLTLTNTNASQTARNLRLNLTGTSGGAQNLIVPAIEKVYIVNNGCADAITVKNSSGTGIAVPAGKTMWVYNDGTNVVNAVTHLTSLTLGAALPVTSGGTGVTTSTGSGNVVLSTSPTLTTPLLGTPTSGNLSNCTGVSLTAGVSGTLPVANGGTGVTASTGSGNNVLSTSPTLVTPILGTPTSGNLANCTGISVTSVSGTLPIANGGTGATSAANARTALDVPSTGGTGATGTWAINISGSAASATTATSATSATTATSATSATTATTATTANALNTSNDYQVNSIGVGTAASASAGEIRATGNVTAYYSDDRLKRRLGYIGGALDKVMSLRGFYYEANEIANQLGYESVREVGLSAQEVQAVLPEIVKPAPIDPQYLTLDYAKLVPLLVEAIKEQQILINNLSKKVNG